MRRLMVAGNWKMHGSVDMTTSLIHGIAESVSKLAASAPQDHLPIDVLVCPPYPYLGVASAAVKSGPIMIGAQNVSQYEQGAFTGEVSLPMLSEMSCHYVLLGHSERRELFTESNAEIAEKFAACVSGDHNVLPVLCVGELLAERQAGDTKKVIDQQLDAVIERVGISAFAHAVIAYEPVWAIGTGETASPEQAQEVHAHIRQKLAALDANVAEKIQVLYGGSVKPENAEQLFAQNDIDGGLIGGASLKAESFAGICQAALKLS